MRAEVTAVTADKRFVLDLCYCWFVTADTAGLLLLILLVCYC